MNSTTDMQYLAADVIVLPFIFIMNAINVLHLLCSPVLQKKNMMTLQRIEVQSWCLGLHVSSASGCAVWASGLVMTPLESPVPFIKLPKLLTPTYEMSYRRHPLAGDLNYTSATTSYHNIFSVFHELVSDDSNFFSPA